MLSQSQTEGRSQYQTNVTIFVEAVHKAGAATAVIAAEKNPIFVPYHSRSSLPSARPTVSLLKRFVEESIRATGCSSRSRKRLRYRAASAP